MRSFLHFCRRICTFLATVTLVAAGAGIVIIVGAYAFIVTHFDGDATLPAECGVVFGAAVSGYDRAGPAIVRRVAAAAELYRAGNVQSLILSGGTGKGSGVSLSEAEVMRREAIALGVAEKDIVLEDASHSTWENLLYSRPLTEHCSSVLAISDQFHLARISFLAWRQGWGSLQTYPAVKRPPEVSEQRSVVREIFAMLYYVLYIDRFLPDIQRNV